MPQTRVEELTTLLLGALDDQGNVLNMVTVSGVVAQLEAMQVTAEDLRVTRLGKHINSIRRQLTDSNKPLAKRMKELVKSWQQLLQARPSNGLPPPTQPTTTTSTPSPRTSTPTPRNSTPVSSDTLKSASPVPSNSSTHPKANQLFASPIKHDPKKLTITSSTPQPAPELFTEDQECNGAPKEAGPDPAKNRQKLLKLLSKVKKPGQPSQPKQTAAKDIAVKVDPVVEHKPKPGMFSSKNFVPVGENGGSSKEHVSTATSEGLPSLRVSLPKDLIKRTPQTSRKTLSKTPKPVKLRSLTVSLSRNAIKLKSELHVVKPELPVINPKSELPVIKPKSELPVIKPKSEFPVIKPKSELPVIKPKSELPVIKPKSELPVIKPKSEFPVIKPKSEKRPKSELPVVPLKSELSELKLEPATELPLIVKLPLKYFNMRSRSHTLKPIAQVAPALPVAQLYQDSKNHPHHFSKCIPEVEKMEIDGPRPIKVEPILKEDKIIRDMIIDNNHVSEDLFSNSETLSADASVVILPYVFIDGVTDAVL